MDGDRNPTSFDDIPDPLAGAGVDLSRAWDGGSPPAAPVVAGPTRAEVRRRRLLAAAVGLGWLALHVAVLGVRADLDRLGVPYVAAQVVLPALLVTVTLGLALRPGRDGLGTGVSLLRWAGILGLAVVLAVALFFPPPFASAATPGLGAFCKSALICADIVAMMGVVPLVLAAVALRGAFASAAAERTLAAAAACGLASVSAMHLHCGNIAPMHVALGHVLPALVLTAIAVALVPRLTRA